MHPTYFTNKYKRLPVIKEVDIFQVCLSIFVIENYKENLRDSDDLFASHYHYRAGNFSKVWLTLKENVDKRFKDRMDVKDYLKDCEDFFCVINYGLRTNINNVPSID